MKLSTISLFGSALAAIVVSAIAAPVACSLQQANLFERDVDGELVDGLFTRANGQQRRQAWTNHMDMAEAELDTAKAQRLAYEAHKELYRKEGDLAHSVTATKHELEAYHHHERCDVNLEAAKAALTGSRTEEQKQLVTNRARKMESIVECKNDAIASRNHANALIAGHPSQHTPLRVHRHLRYAN